jgi:hypothetical protein
MAMLSCACRIAQPDRAERARAVTFDEPFVSAASTERLMNHVSSSHLVRPSYFLRLTLLTSCVVALVCSATSCGDDSGDKTPTAGSSGAGTSGGGGSSGSTAGAPAAAPPVPCGSAMCTPRPSALTGLLAGLGMGAAALPGLPTPVACCVDEAKGMCGSAASEGATCEIPPTPDTRCPGVNLGALGAAAGGATAALGNLMTGCCTLAGQCGLDGSIFGRGCVENGEAKAMLGAIPLIGTLIMTPAAIACDHPVDDAGAGDAGI